VTAHLVQADPVLDGRAFWRTRPIAPRSLLAAKFGALALLLIGVPIAITAGRLATYGAPFTSLLVMGVQLALSRGAWIAIGLVVAALTGTMVRFILAIVGAVAAAVTTLVLVVQWLASSAGGVGSVSAGWGGIGPMGMGMWPLALVLCGGLFAAALAYGRRWRWVPGGVLLVAVLAPDALLGDHGQRRVLLGLPPGVATMADATPAAEPAGLVPSWHVEAWRRGDRPVQLQVRFRLSSLPPQYTADLPEPRAELRLADGTRLTGSGQSAGGMHEFGALNVVAGTSLCDDARTPFCSREIEMRLVELDERQRAALARGGGRLVISGDLHVAQHRVAGVLPLRRGAALRRPGYLLEVLTAAQQSSGLSLGGRLTRFATFSATPLPRVDLFARRGSVVTALAMVPASLTTIPPIVGPTHSPLTPRLWGADVQAPFVASLGQRQLPYRVEPKADWSGEVELVVVESAYIGSTPVRWRMDDLQVSQSD
jgi:hypothetical protein